MTLASRFRILALPWGGPIPRKGAPRGVDLDGEFFTRDTATGLTVHSERPVYFHHRVDPLRLMGSVQLGTASGWRRMEDGWLADVTLDERLPQVELLRLLSDRVPLYGSTSVVRGGRTASETGELIRWIVDELSLSPAPQNVYSVIFD